ncbi:MAG: hypothetical protein ACREXU_09770, partial [Gammaproteobacteria bacterium]
MLPFEFMVLGYRALPWRPDERCEHALTPDGRARPCRAAEPQPEIVQANLRPPTVPRDGGVLPHAATQFECLDRLAPARTRDGRAILANDMHLSLGVPNVFPVRRPSRGFSRSGWIR